MKIVALDPGQNMTKFLRTNETVIFKLNFLEQDSVFANPQFLPKAMICCNFRCFVGINLTRYSFILENFMREAVLVTLLFEKHHKDFPLLIIPQDAEDDHPSCDD